MSGSAAAGDVANNNNKGLERPAGAILQGGEFGPACDGGPEQFEWVIGADGKARRVKPGIRLLVDGFPNRVGLLRGFGNAIDPRPAAGFIKAALT